MYKKWINFSLSVSFFLIVFLNSYMCFFCADTFYVFRDLFYEYFCRGRLGYFTQHYYTIYTYLSTRTIDGISVVVASRYSFIIKMHCTLFVAPKNRTDFAFTSSLLYLESFVVEPGSEDR